MARFSGLVGFSDQQVETSPGIWESKTVERRLRGDILRHAFSFQAPDKINDDLTISNRVSVVADEFAFKNYPTITYVKWNNVAWKVTEVEVQRPRLILSLGGVYHGQGR